MVSFVSVDSHCQLAYALHDAESLLSVVVNNDTDEV